MNKEQEAKFEKWYCNPNYRFISQDVARALWDLAHTVESINTEEPMETPAAPEWVIDMMLRGKPVRCKVWDGENDDPQDVLIVGYVLSSCIYYDDQERSWKHAEPLPYWKPKEGEAVLYCGPDERAVAGVYSAGPIFECVHHSNMNGMARLSWMRPFDASKIGKPWSEI